MKWPDIISIVAGKSRWNIQWRKKKYWKSVVMKKKIMKERKYLKMKVKLLMKYGEKRHSNDIENESNNKWKWNIFVFERLNDENRERRNEERK